MTYQKLVLSEIEFDIIHYYNRSAVGHLNHLFILCLIKNIAIRNQL